jgi:hypothetical protein
LDERKQMTLKVKHELSVHFNVLAFRNHFVLLAQSPEGYQLLRAEQTAEQRTPDQPVKVSQL